MNKLITKLQEGIETCEKMRQDMDASSFDTVDGVIISANEAKLLVKWLKLLKSLIKMLSKV